MKSRPILFRGDMVRAILAGQKTQTRREVKLPFEVPKGDWYPDLYRGKKPHTQWTFWERVNGKDTGKSCLPQFTCPYGTAGDELWVRETWNALYPQLYPQEGDMPWYFHELGAEGARRAIARGAQPTAIHRANPDDPNLPTKDDIEAGFRWQPNIFMPRWACRLLLTITDVRVERIQSISEADARAEGISDEQIHEHGSARAAFAALWDSIHGDTDHEWGKNPYVWVVEFSRKEQA